MLNRILRSPIWVWNYHLHFQRELLGIQRDQARTDLDFSNATYMERKRSIELDNKVKAAQMSSFLLSNQAKRIENKYLDGVSQARISLMADEAFQAVENGNLSISRAKESIAHAILMAAQEKGQAIDNKKAGALADSYISAMSLAYGNTIEIENAISEGWSSFKKKTKLYNDWKEKAAHKRLMPSYEQKHKAGLVSSIFTGSMEQNW